jgi:hypothetical protein
MLEKKVAGVVADYMASGKIEEKITEALDNAMADLTRGYGDLTRLIEQEIKAAIAPVIERSDYSQYVTKLDATLVEILKNKTAGSNQILENFKEVASVPKEITTEQIFERYCKFVSGHVETSGLEVDFDDRPYYRPVSVHMEFDSRERRWGFSDGQEYLVRCYCDEDENLEVTFELTPRYKDKFKVVARQEDGFDSLRSMTDFQAFLLGLQLEWSRVTIDDKSGYDDEIEVEAEPEASFS